MHFERYLEDNMFNLHHQLVNQTYRHGRYTTFHIYDPKHRIISKATVRDRLVHHLVFAKLYEIFDPTFIFHSYSSRLDKGSHRAVENLRKALREESQNGSRQTYVLKCDIKQFFHSVPHNLLLQIIEKRIKDKRFLWLIREILGSFSQGKGIPIGNLTSQIFANIFLNELDQFVKHKLGVKYYFRYADDFAIVHKDRNYLEEILKWVSVFVSGRLGVYLHPNKIELRKYTQGIDFLGYIILPKYIGIRRKTKNRMLKKLSYKDDLLTAGELEFDSFYQTVQSYLGMLKHSNNYSLENTIKNNFLLR